ncbi:hypothetical protein HPB50_021037 [Hyalomma asiaticum]|uniref:Uncharacterized protein n=1 Tax=Hyalomma asiaticum TaxID=266040 RepID=A0ACB7S8S7_HYAAI|nr:hypothetical protein HPB50_021037 [Hyalomma asiaticum]
MAVRMKVNEEKKDEKEVRPRYVSVPGTWSQRHHAGSSSCAGRLAGRKRGVYPDDSLCRGDEKKNRLLQCIELKFKAETK